MMSSLPRREEKNYLAAEETLEWRLFKTEELEIPRRANRQTYSHLYGLGSQGCQLEIRIIPSPMKTILSPTMLPQTCTTVIVWVLMRLL